MAPVLPVPRTWPDLTPSWVTAALARQCPGAVIDEVEVGTITDGTNRRARLRLSYRAGTGPSSVFVKMHGRMRHRLALIALGAFAAEARLADCGVRLPLEYPVQYAAGIDWPRLAVIVVMEDVTPRGCPNDATTPLSVPQVRSGLDELARLHAAFWDRPLPAPLSFLRPWRLRGIWAPLSRASLARGLGRLAAADNGAVAALPVDASSLERQFRRSATLAATGPQTVLHGDPHPGNTYALPGEVTGFCDWQLIRTGNWSHDVGYFLAGSLGIADRRAHERDLLQGYLDGLRQAGADAPRFREAWNRYRACPAFGLSTWLHTLSAGTFQPANISMATIARFAAAYQDLDAHRSLAAGDG